MEIEEDDLEKHQNEIVKNLKNKIQKRLEILKNGIITYTKERKIIYRSLAGLLEKIAVGCFVVVLFPDEIGWRPIYAFVTGLVLFIFSVKFNIDGKE